MTARSVPQSIPRTSAYRGLPGPIPRHRVDDAGAMSAGVHQHLWRSRRAL